MLDLESDRWGDLRHSYGSASNIPALLRAVPLARKPVDSRSEPFFSLWSALCHQYEVYPASFAAAPHLVAAAAVLAPDQRVDCLLLVGAIETYRHRPAAPPIPDDLAPAYGAAIRRATALTLESLTADIESDSLVALLGALAAFRGQPRFAAAIADLEGEIVCPVCDATFVTPGFNCF